MTQHSQRQLHLGAFFFGAGHHLAAWRHPDVDPQAYTRLASLQAWARIAEAAKFDAIFFADNVGLSDAPAGVLARNALPHVFDPLLVQSALAGVTERNYYGTGVVIDAERGLIALEAFAMAALAIGLAVALPERIAGRRPLRVVVILGTDAQELLRRITATV